MFFGHLGEVAILLVVGLIVFGPKRMIQIGGQVGRMLRELQATMRDMNWNPLSGDETPSPTGASPLSKLSQISQDLIARRDVAEEPATRDRLHVVDVTNEPERTPVE